MLHDPVSQRIHKINSLIEHLLPEILIRELSLKSGVFITVAKVDTSPDLRYTRIFVSVFPIAEEAYVSATLRKEMHRLQHALGQQMKTRTIPRIEFHFDHTQENVSKLDEIFDQIHKEQSND